MKSIIFSFLLVMLVNFTTNAQTTLTETSESLKADAEKLDAEAKVKTQEGYDLRKQATAKKLQANKEKEKAISESLKNEALQIELQSKTKLEEAANIKKQASAKRKQATELVKQKNTKPNHPINSAINPQIKQIIDKPQTSAINNPKAYVEIFEFPNYSGRSVKIPYNIDPRFPKVKAEQSTKYNPLPFQAVNISIKFSHPQLLAYLNIGEENTIMVHSDLPSLNLPFKTIRTIAVDHKLVIAISLEAILTEIHNNDCKKMYGNISVDLFTSDINRSQILGLLIDKNIILNGNPWVCQTLK